jgi:putative hydrolase of the HAD superfamily
MKQYRCLLLDWDDTIGDWSDAAYKAQQDLYDKYLFHRFCKSFSQWFDLYHEHNNLLWEQYGRNEITKQYLQTDRFLYPLMQATGESSTEPLKDLAEQLGNDFLTLTNKYFSLLPGAADTVRELAQHFPLTIVSNGFVEVQYYKLIHSGLRDCFQHVILSEEAGYQKPDPRIFELALQRNNEDFVRRGKKPLTAADLLMIGDGYGSDIKGAIATGIDQLWLCPDKDALADDTRPATYKVLSINKILPLMGIRRN